MNNVVRPELYSFDPITDEERERWRTEMEDREFKSFLTIMAQRAHDNSVAHGFWPETKEGKQNLDFKMSRLALMHSELSECLEGLRKDLPDDHLPNRSMEVAELADLIIRALDYAGGYNLPLGEVILEKMAYNKGRPYKHGKLA